jgi:Protein of unknown function (DUF664)
VGYYDAVHQQTIRSVEQLTDVDLDRVVDRSWDPPVTLGVRLVSVIADDLQHAGQAALSAVSSSAARRWCRRLPVGRPDCATAGSATARMRP